LAALKKHRWFGWLVVISLVCLFIGLYRADYLFVPEFHSYPALALSLVCLFAGFLGQVAGWWSILRGTEYVASYPDCLASMGLSVFTKYIPGKVMIIVGRAAWLAERHGHPLGVLTVLSLNTQLIALWAGLSVGCFALVPIGGLHDWTWAVVVAWLILSVPVFSERAQVAAAAVVKRLSAGRLNLPRLEVRSVIRILPVFASSWLAWSLGFYFLITAIQPDPVPMPLGLGFSLAMTLGVLAVIMPGGLGVREGVLVAYLTLAGFSVETATTVSLVSRLWYLIGEAFVFAAGAWASRSGRS
jgi:uncharacterized membrane protein YbhN (UPF0104 family)